MDTKNLVNLAKAYAAHKGIKTTSVAQYATKDARFFLSLTAGQSCTVRRFNEVIAWFSTNWPDELAWPIAVERPNKKPALRHIGKRELARAKKIERAAQKKAA